MTRQSNFEKGTEFSEWLRSQSEIDSSKGFIATNLDYIWNNYKTGQWMIIEEKRRYNKYGFPVLSRPQRSIFNLIHNACKSSGSHQYLGFYLIVFGNTNPEDGKIWINNEYNEITKSELLRFMQFDFSVIKRAAVAK